MEFRIRTITIGIGEPHPISPDSITRASTFLQKAASRLTNAGFEVQTTRISTRSLFADRLHAKGQEILMYATQLQRFCDDRQLSYLSLGPAFADDPSFPIERIRLLSDMLIPNESLNASVQLASTRNGSRYEAAVPTAKVVKAIGQGTPNGLGNMRFAMVANAPMHGPFFPTAYHPDSEWGFSIGLQSANLFRSTIQEATQLQKSGPVLLATITSLLIEKLESSLHDLATLADSIAQEHKLTFFGFDLSPAPNGDESIATAFEAAGIGLFGEPATLALTAAVTNALKKVKLKTCGYNGVFFPVLEDSGIARRIKTNGVTTSQLLLYSSVCGAGLDTVPVADDISIEHLAGTMLDVAALSVRMNKPLSARLMPAPGKHVGEVADFGSPWLIPAVVMKL